MTWFVQRQPLVGGGAALALLLGISWFADRNLSNLRQANASVEHTHQVEATLNALVLHITEAETGQRGYLLTGDSRYLNHYQLAVQALHPESQDLRRLTADNAVQQRHLDDLEPLLSAKLDELQTTIHLRQQQGFDAARKIVLSDRGKLLLDQIKQSTSEMADQEQRLLRERTATAQQLERNTGLTLILGSLVAVGGMVLAMWTLHRDIGKRLQAEAALNALNEDLEERVDHRTAQLEAASRAKDEFLSILSHELRTPLNAMLGWARLLRSGTLPAPGVTQALEVIERNAKTQAQLIDDLLDISRVIQGKLRLNVRPIQPAEVIEAALDTVRPAAEARSIRLQVTLDSAAGPIAGDSERLQQVVWNLVSNAIKFTPKGGRVQVRLERINSHIEMTVSDSGQGIASDFLPYVFERFRQSDSTSTRTYGGLGLGLAIVRQLVELHGGSVRADSPGEGQGATFTVVLPLMILHRPLQLPERLHPHIDSQVPYRPSAVLTGLTILVVDDEADARVLLTTLLEQCGATVVAVATVSEALQALAQYQPAALVSDIGMPDTDGYALIQQVRALPPEQGGTVPAVALTAYARVEDRIRALAAGFQSHLPKPIEPAELLAILATLTHRTGSL